MDTGAGAIYAAGCFWEHTGQLGEVLQKLQPGLKVLYGTDTIQTYPAGR